MDEFSALIQSLGEHAVDYIGKDNLLRLDVFGDEVDQSAHVEIFLCSEEWGDHSSAIDKMIELREMFMDDLAVDYRFAGADSSTVEDKNARHPAFQMAG